MLGGNRDGQASPDLQSSGIKTKEFLEKNYGKTW